MWRPERRQPENHSVRNRLIAAGAVAGGLAATAFGVRELARRGYLGERAQAALGGASVGEVAAVEEAGLSVPQTTTGVNEGAVSAAGGAETSAAGPREAGGPGRLAP
jgi:hypothetical protein